MIRFPFFSSPTALKAVSILGLGLGLTIAVGRAQAAQIIETSDVWQPPQSIKGAKPSFMVFDGSRNGLWTANGGIDRVSLSDASNGELLCTIRVGHNPTSLALDEARSTLWVVNAKDATLYAIDTRTNIIKAKVTTGKGAQIAAVDPTTGTVFTANCEADTVTAFNPSSLQLDEIRVGNKPLGVAIDVSRRRAYISNYGSGSISILDADSHRSIGQIEVAAKPVTLAVDGTSGALFVTHSEAGTIGIVPNAELGETRTVTTGGYPLGLGIDTKRGLVFVNDYDNAKLCIIDINGNFIDDFDVAPTPTGLAFNTRSGRIFVCSEESGQLDILDLKSSTRPAVDLALLNRPTTPTRAALQPQIISQNQADFSGSSVSLQGAALQSESANPQTQVGLDGESPSDNDATLANLPVAKTLEDNSVQRFAAMTTPNIFPDSSGNLSGNIRMGSSSPLQPSHQPARVRRAPRRRIAPVYQFEQSPKTGLGYSIALQAHKMQDSGAYASYHHECDRLADTTIRRATPYFNNIVRPIPGDTAAKTMRRFQKARIGFPYSSSVKLRAGDILYSGSQFGGGCGHVMIVGFKGKILDQYGAKSRATTRPHWVVRPR